MKKSSIKQLCVCVLGLIMTLWLTIPVSANSTEVKPVDMTQWMKTLPEVTQEQVLEVLQTNMALAENEGENGDISSARLLRRILRDLKMVLSAQQLNQYLELYKAKPTGQRLSAVRATCSQCYWINQMSLSNAESNLGMAQSLFDDAAYNCSWPPWGPPAHPIKLYMDAAEQFLNSARSDTSAAYSTCDCARARSALTNAQTALSYLNSAISDTQNNCDPNPPWLSYLLDARTWLQNAINSLPDCINQACN